MLPTSLRARLLAWSISLVVVFVALGIAVLSHVVSAYGERQVAIDLENARIGYRSHFALRAGVLRERARFLSQSPLLRAAIGTGDRATIEDVLRDVTMGGPRNLVMVVRGDDPRAIVSAAQRAPADVSALRLESADETLDTAILCGGSLFHVAATGILDGDRLAAILAVGEPFDGQAAREIASATAQDVVLLAGGQVLATGLHAQQDDQPAPELLRPGEAKALLQSVAATGHLGSTVVVTLGGHQRLALAMPLHAAGGSLVLSRDPKELETLLATARLLLVVIGLAMAGVGVLASLRVGRRLTAPLRCLTGAAQSMAAGRFEERVAVTGSDEIAQLGVAYNHMADTIGALMRDLCEHAARAEVANHAKDGFLASMSHELRTPVTNIRAHAEILASYGDETSPAERAEFVGVILDQTRRLETLIGRVLDFASLTAGELGRATGSADLARAVRDAVAELQAAAAAREVRVRVAAPAALPVVGNGGRLQQLAAHLIENAVAFSPPGSEVEVRLSQGDRAVELRVIDHGPGVAGALKDRVFEPFFQSTDYLTDKPAGLGLGLTFARAIAEAHGGSVWCEDTTGGGATFVLAVPQRERAALRPDDFESLAVAAAEPAATSLAH